MPDPEERQKLETLVYLRPHLVIGRTFYRLKVSG